VEAHGAELQISLVAQGIGLGIVPARVLRTSRLGREGRRVVVPGYDVLLPALDRFEAAIEERLARQETQRDVRVRR
jgi:DNA-binding transcriptional LysR family regulator